MIENFFRNVQNIRKNVYDIIISTIYHENIPPGRYHRLYSYCVLYAALIVCLICFRVNSCIFICLYYPLIHKTNTSKKKENKIHK